MIVGTVALILCVLDDLRGTGMAQSRHARRARLEPARGCWASWFQAVTPRTAGFNTLDIGQMHDSTVLMTMTLMLVGGGSTSTAGGIKVTTCIVLLLATAAFFKRRTRCTPLAARLGLDEVMKVMALTTVSILVVLCRALHHLDQP